MQPPDSNQPPHNPYASPQQVPQPVYGGTSAGSEAVSMVVPYRNASALIAYYMAVFSLIPCLGLILGPIAFVLGIIGFRTYLRNPQLHGVAHAWIGIILGGLMGILNIAGVSMMAFAVARG